MFVCFGFLRQLQLISEQSVDVSGLDVVTQMRELIRWGIPGLDYVNRKSINFSSVDVLNYF